jgi:hypothetical protein
MRAFSYRTVAFSHHFEWQDCTKSEAEGGPDAVSNEFAGICCIDPLSITQSDMKDRSS